LNALDDRITEERRDLATRAGRDRLSSWLDVHPSNLAPLPKPSVEALNALIDVAFLASGEGQNLRREADDLRIAAARLKDLAHKDPLTGLANRRAIEERLSAEWDRAQRYGRPLAILSGDVDGLKDVNDRLGHQAGDALLQAAAVCMRDSLRGGDLAGRMGGDEFIVICPETDLLAVQSVVEKLQIAIAAATVTTRDGQVGLRMSIGWAAASAAPDVETLLRLADEELYRDKARGRENPAN
jgi:two-component system cell cycle response regulator